MGMFDYYRPATDIRCPVCGGALSEWQGKDGPCGLFVWQEGIAAPVEQQVAEEVMLADSDRESVRLPKQFLIYSHDCDCQFRVEAICEASTGTWNQTRVITAETAVQQGEETRAQFKARIRWLQGKH